MSLRHTSKETGVAMVFWQAHAVFIQRARQALETNTNSMDVFALPSVVKSDLPGFTDAGASATGQRGWVPVWWR